MDDKRAKNPQKKLRALYMTAAGSTPVRVIPMGGIVTIGTESWKIEPHHRWQRGKGVKFDLVLPQGKSEPVAPWGANSPVSAQEFDAAAGNNLVEQIHRATRPSKTPGISWVQVGLSALCILALIGFGFKESQDFDNVKTMIKQTHPEYFVAPGTAGTTNHDVVAVQNHPNVQAGG